VKFQTVYNFLVDHYIPIPYQITTDLLESEVNVNYGKDSDGSDSLMFVSVKPLNEGDPIPCQFVMELKGNKGIWWDNTFYPAFDEDGQPSPMNVALGMSLTDVRLEQQFTTILESVGTESLEQFAEFFPQRLEQHREELAAAAALEAAEAEAAALELATPDYTEVGDLDLTDETQADLDNSKPWEVGTFYNITTDGTLTWDGGFHTQEVTAGQFILIDATGKPTIQDTHPNTVVVVYNDVGQINPSESPSLDVLANPQPNDVYEITADGVLTWEAGTKTQIVTAGQFLVVDNTGNFTFVDAHPSEATEETTEGDSEATDDSTSVDGETNTDDDSGDSISGDGDGSTTDSTSADGTTTGDSDSADSTSTDADSSTTGDGTTTSDDSSTTVSTSDGSTDGSDGSDGSSTDGSTTDGSSDGSSSSTDGSTDGSSTDGSTDGSTPST
jgi:hypothetical protein